MFLCSCRENKAEECEQLKAQLVAAQKAVLDYDLAEQQIQALEQERNGMREQMQQQSQAVAQLTAELQAERERSAKAAAQSAAVQRQAMALQAEVEMLRQKNIEEEKAFQFLEGERDALQTEVRQGKAMAARLEESQRQVNILQEEQSSLQIELATNKQQRRNLHSQVTRSLSNLSDKLGSAKTSWNPWEEINDVEQQLTNIKDTVGEQDGKVEGA